MLLVNIYIYITCAGFDPWPPSFCTQKLTAGGEKQIESCFHCLSHWSSHIENRHGDISYAGKRSPVAKNMKVVIFGLFIQRGDGSNKHRSIFLLFLAASFALIKKKKNSRSPQCMLVLHQSLCLQEMDKQLFLSDLQRPIAKNKTNKIKLNSY